MLGYRVHFLIKGDRTFEDYPTATKVEVRQNHLHVIDMRLGEVIAIYQSGWWIKAHLIGDKADGV